MAKQIDLGERLVRLADRVLSRNTNQTIGHTGGITNATATDTSVPTTKAVKEYIDEHQHTHGALTYDGKIGNAGGKIITTSNSGALQASNNIQANLIYDNDTPLLTILDNKISKSNTAGFVKNDGTIDTTSYSETSHSHGQITHDGKNTTTTSTVNKVVVTDSSNIIKVIAKVPFANLNIVKANITGLGIPDNDTLRSIYKYEITQINKQNFRYGDALVVTGRVTNLLGEGVSGETVKLYKKNVNVDGTVTNVEKDTDTTGDSGSFYLTTSTDSWGLCEYNVGDAHFTINVNQWTRVNDADTYRFYRNDTHARLVLYGWKNKTTDITTTWQWNHTNHQYSTYFGGGITYAEYMRPEMHQTGLNSFGDAYIRINSTGSVSLKAISARIPKETEFYCQIEWAICEEDINKPPQIGNTKP